MLTHTDTVSKCANWPALLAATCWQQSCWGRATTRTLFTSTKLFYLSPTLYFFKHWSCRHAKPPNRRQLPTCLLCLRYRWLMNGFDVQKTSCYHWCFLSRKAITNTVCNSNSNVSDACSFLASFFYFNFTSHWTRRQRQLFSTEFGATI